MPKSRRIRQIRAFTVFFEQTYRSAGAAEKLINQIKRRGNLRKALKDADKIKRLQQAHHVIPVETVMQSRLVQKAVLEGFEINGVDNGIALSIAQHKRRHTELASYNRYVLQELVVLEEKFPKCTRATAKREVEKLLKVLIQGF